MSGNRLSCPEDHNVRTHGVSSGCAPSAFTSRPRCDVSSIIAVQTSASTMRSCKSSLLNEVRREELPGWKL